MKRDEQICTSLLDDDFYKFTMGQMIFHKHPHALVQFSFLNRTKSVRLAEHIDMGELREQLDACRQLRMSDNDLRFLMGTSYDYGQSMFHLDYINFLKGLVLPDYSLKKTNDGQLNLQFFGDWAQVTHWEVKAMFIVKELYRKAFLKTLTEAEREQILKEGRDRLARKIVLLSKHRDVTFSDFGTRRRFSFESQDYVVEQLVKYFKKCQFRGTSNVLLAKKYGITPMGTNAHELPMAYSGIYYDQDETDPAFSSRQVLTDWEEEYGLALSIFLSDTFGSDWFFNNVVTLKQLKTWKGPRNDSEDPYVFSDKMIVRYKKADIDPMAHFVVDADGQTPDTMIAIQDRYNHTMPHTFGPGTNLSDDYGLDNLSIVVKVTRAGGHAVCKLSDNLDKATGDLEAIERAKRLRGYNVTHREACIY